MYLYDNINEHTLENLKNDRKLSFIFIPLALFKSLQPITGRVYIMY